MDATNTPSPSGPPDHAPTPTPTPTIDRRILVYDNGKGEVRADPVILNFQLLAAAQRLRCDFDELYAAWAKMNAPVESPVEPPAPGGPSPSGNEAETGTDTAPRPAPPLVAPPIDYTRYLAVMVRLVALVRAAFGITSIEEDEATGLDANATLRVLYQYLDFQAKKNTSTAASHDSSAPTAGDRPGS